MIYPFLNFLFIIIIILCKFFTLALGDSLLMEYKWQQVSSTLFSILADLSNTAVWMIFAHPLISNSSSCLKSLGIILGALITIRITVTSMFHSYFSSLARSRWLSVFVFFYFLSVVCRNDKIHYSLGSVLFCLLSFVQVFWLGFGDLFKIPENFVHLILQDGFRFVHIPFCIMVKF